MTSIPPRPRQTSRYYAPGEVIGGKYELLKPLGEGGMGSVWLARNQALESPVALKLLRADLDTEDADERLMQEARAAARIGHRAIVRVFDFGRTDQGDPFIVMELLEGESLADVLATRGRLSPVKAVQILLPVIDALAAAHDRGIVHRDLKPDNIFLVREGRRTQPKVVDFGIAKVEQEAAGPSRTLTRQGTVLGSPGYMSPEQARGLSGIDQRTDVWSVCVVLYECITGQGAFEGDNYNALMRNIIEADVVPTTELAAGDAALWTVLERGLRKLPGDRYPNMRALGAALAEWLLSHDVDQDVCGEPIGALFEPPPTASGPRDILSVPPPSLVGRSSNPGLRGRSSTPGGGIATLNQPSSPSELTDSSAGSVSAIIRSRTPPAMRNVLPWAGGAAFLGLVIILWAVFSHRDAPATASTAPALPAKGATPAAAVAAAAPVAKPIATPEPQKPVVASAEPAKSEPPRAATKTPAQKNPKKATPESTRPLPQSGSSDLKDPYR